MKEALPIATAKARFAECVRHAERGGSVVLTRHGRPVARLSPLDERGSSNALLDVATAQVHEAADEYETLHVGHAHGTRVAANPEVRREALERLLRESIWPHIPENQLGVGIDKRQRERILGYESDGV